MEQLIASEKDYMPHFLKKLRLYIELHRNSTLNIPIKIYLLSSLSSSSNEVFFTAGVSSWTTGSFVKSMTLSQNGAGIYDMSDRDMWCHFILWWL